jgi:hypothetical protein
MLFAVDGYCVASTRNLLWNDISDGWMDAEPFSYYGL